ncbi:hypothetical protein [Alkalimonas sp.]|uniref:hypothetical protein n=1 Tax=Alkalimonas sp. TaxID=1872453 RepID=UPI00263B9F94|nr:hypothetical protein [Alkalimonas sp.]MCC5826104.1 hypothetical protein [Alkalimonas sp.]
MEALLQHKTRIALLVLVLLASGVAWLLQSDHSTLSCQTSAECATQFSWLSWLQGQSRSSQFHFVDLVELLDRMLPVNNDNK